jgi:hypothetical protein
MLQAADRGGSGGQEGKFAVGVTATVVSFPQLNTGQTPTNSSNDEVPIPWFTLCSNIHRQGQIGMLNNVTRRNTQTQHVNYVAGASLHRLFNSTVLPESERCQENSGARLIWWEQLHRRQVTHVRIYHARPSDLQEETSKKTCR